MNRSLIIILVLIKSLVVSAQIPKEEVLVDVSVFPTEKPVLTVNSEILLAGESLQYKISVLNHLNIKSDLSKIAYVSLRNQNDSIIFNQKLKLLNGSGYSDFFLPANLKTGVYYLIGYTNFSRNNETEAIDKKMVYVINTFLENKIEFQATDTTNLRRSHNVNSEFLGRDKKEQPISITTDKQIYGYREKVNFTLNPNLNNNGDFLLSVRRIDSIEIPHIVSKIKQVRKSSIFYLPELRGELISGVVLSKTDNLPIVNQPVSLTILEKNFIFKLAKTDQTGRFFFSISEDYNPGKCVVQIIGGKEEIKEYTINLDDKHLHLNQSKKIVLNLDSNLKEWLQERSVQLQIENAYFERKQDSVLSIKSHSPFYNNLGTLYLLDDYTRFPTVRETFIEIIKLAAVRGSGENIRFLVYNEYDPNGLGKFNNIPPLVLVDGMMIQDNNAFLNFNSREIESIRVVNKPYRYGPKLFSGIIVVKTKNNDFSSLINTNVLEFDLQSAAQEKIYYNFNNLQDLSSSRIPDYRAQLHWNPQIHLSNTEFKSSFLTSEVPGIYEIRLEGYDENGTKILIKKHITVAQN